MQTLVVISRHAEKDLVKIPKHIFEKFEDWVKFLEKYGLRTMQQVNGYRDHALHGNRKGQRSSSLTRSWRVIYSLNEEENILTIEVLEVNHHEY